MRLFSLSISLEHLLILVLLLASFCYQLAVFLYSSGQRWRCWRLLLLGLLLVYNCVSGIFPNVALSVSLSLQYILRYGIGFALGSCFPLYFYKVHGMMEFLFHLRFGVPVCYGLSFLVFFCVVLPLDGDVDWVLRWGMLLPFLCALSLFVVLGFAVYRKLSERESLHLRGSVDELVLSVISVAPWIFVTLFVYWEVAPWLKVWVMNVGFWNCNRKVETFLCSFCFFLINSLLDLFRSVIVQC